MLWWHTWLLSGVKYAWPTVCLPRLVRRRGNGQNVIPYKQQPAVMQSPGRTDQMKRIVLLLGHNSFRHQDAYETEWTAVHMRLFEVYNASAILIRCTVNFLRSVWINTFAILTVLLNLIQKTIPWCQKTSNKVAGWAARPYMSSQMYLDRKSVV